VAASSDKSPPAGASAGGPPCLAGSRTSFGRVAADRLFRWAVVAGGVAIILSILGILIFIGIEAWPLTRGADVSPGVQHRVPGLPEGPIVGDEYGEKLVHLAPNGTIRIVELASGAVLDERAWPGLAPEPTSSGMPTEALRLSGLRVVPGESTFVGATARGELISLTVKFRVVFDEARQREVRVQLEPPVVVPVAEPGAQIGAFDLRVDSTGGWTAAAALTDGRLFVVRRTVKRNALTGAETETLASADRRPPLPVADLLLTGSQNQLVAGLADGRLLSWDLTGGLDRPEQITRRGGEPVTALTFLIGDRAIVAGREDGGLEIWFLLRDEAGYGLRYVREFPPLEAAVRGLSPSMRDKGFLALDERGGMGLFYSTSHRTLWRGRAPLEDATRVHFAPRADAALVAAEGRVAVSRIENPHPEVSLRALFGKVWYESYKEPEFVWQSSSASDDFEPKLSMTPLIFGTLKGTFYSLLLAIPMGVFGAMYASEFMHPSLKRFVKPTIEIMAALPSVVLGFLAGLWLAPRLESGFPALLMMLVLLPPVVIGVGLGWRQLPGKVRNRVPLGSEVALYAIAIVIVSLTCIEASPALEDALFGGSVPQWLFETTGLRYDQRNAVVIGIAMGFAVIPIIFSVAEDAFSNVPRSLVSGSLALGATRWQTVTRIVLPTASPGIFSAIMIGFGRAVGETMIVLMATGNTPIMDWSPFTGFRTLSANIAVEIPEAPQGETLYRTLFLAALLLFLLTFLINTAAEIVRHRLRRRYANL
jgi:phosphate transport system permease protein